MLAKINVHFYLILVYESIECLKSVRKILSIEPLLKYCYRYATVAPVNYLQAENKSNHEACFNEYNKAYERLKESNIATRMQSGTTINQFFHTSTPALIPATCWHLDFSCVFQILKCLHGKRQPRYSSRLAPSLFHQSRLLK